MELSDDYYEVLGISRDANGEQIKKAYRKLALRWHPDKNLDKRELAEANFKRLAEAYEVLSDSRKRQIYDQYGKDGLINGAGFDGRAADFGVPDFFGGAFNPFGRMSGFNFRDPNDVFKEFFGNTDPFGNFFTEMSDNPPNVNGRMGGSASTTMFSDPFGMFSQMGGFGGMSTMSMQMSSIGAGGPNVKQISTSVKTVNGKRVETKRIIENGVETVIVSENGQIKSRTVNGQPQLTN